MSIVDDQDFVEVGSDAANDLSAWLDLEQKWKPLHEKALRDQHAMDETIRLHLAGAGKAPTQGMKQSLESLWLQEDMYRNAMNDFIDKRFE